MGGSEYKIFENVLKMRSFDHPYSFIKNQCDKSVSFHLIENKTFHVNNTTTMSLP